MILRKKDSSLRILISRKHILMRVFLLNGVTSSALLNVYALEKYYCKLLLEWTASM